MQFLTALSASSWLQLGAGVCGFIAAILLAAPPFLSIDSRKTLIQAANLKLSVSDQTILAEQERYLLQSSLYELEQERHFMRWGLLLLATSFIFSIAGAIAAR